MLHVACMYERSDYLIERLFGMHVARACMIVRRNAFYMELYSLCKPPRPLSGIRRLSAIRVLLLHYIYGDFSWYIWQCPLYGRCPLLGVSINGESTVHVATRLCLLT